MIPWNKICCAVDFSETSRAALEQAVALASSLDADLTLVHVLPAPLQAATGVLVSSRGVAAAEAERSEADLARWREDAARRLGRTVRARALWGEPAAEIVRDAREEGYDLLVLGTHGRSGLPRLVLGSVAERVARQAVCPVLVVHDHVALERLRTAEEAAMYR